MDETLSLSERILAAIACRLRGIRKADGYRTDAGLRVFDSRRTIDPKNGSCLVYWDGGETPAQGTGAGNHTSMTQALTITVEASALADQAATGKELQLLKADVKRAMLLGTGGLSDGDGTLGVVAYSGAQPAAREDGDSAETVVLTFTLTFKEAYGDPYASR